MTKNDDATICHNMKMKELEFERATVELANRYDKAKHERSLERVRIKSAEIRKNYERKWHPPKR